MTITPRAIAQEALRLHCACPGYWMLRASERRLHLAEQARSASQTLRILRTPLESFRT